MIGKHTRYILKKASLQNTIDIATDVHRNDIIDAAVGTGIGSIASSIMGTKELLKNLKGTEDKPGKSNIAQAGVKAAPVVLGTFLGSHLGTGLGIGVNNLIRNKLKDKYDESKHSVLPILGAVAGIYGGAALGRYFAPQLETAINSTGRFKMKK